MDAVARYITAIREVVLEFWIEEEQERLGLNANGRKIRSDKGKKHGPTKGQKHTQGYVARYT